MWPEISMIALAAFISFFFARISKKLDTNREESKTQMEEIKLQIREGRECEMNYVDRLGEMSHKLATSVREKGCFNGSLKTVIENFEDADTERKEFKNKVAAKSG